MCKVLDMHWVVLEAYPGSTPILHTISLTTFPPQNPAKSNYERSQNATARPRIAWISDVVYGDRDEGAGAEHNHDRRGRRDEFRRREHLDADAAARRNS